MLIEEPSQEETDSLLESLSGDFFTNWKTAFHEKRNLPFTSSVALSREKRTYYYLVESNLVSVFWGNITAATLSSFARILPATPAGNCAMCLKALFEEQAFLKCRLQEKTQIVVKLEPDGVHVFKELQLLMPGLQLNPGFYWDATLPTPTN